MALSYKVIFENNKKWVEKKLGEDADFFKNLAKEQNPEYLYIGCSDSRVTTEELMGLKPGEVFVHRNIANLVNTLDLNAISAIRRRTPKSKTYHCLRALRLWRHKSCDEPRGFGTTESLAQKYPRYLQTPSHRTRRHN